MLMLRKYKEEESEKIKSILKKQGVTDLELNGIVYIIWEDGEIKGVSKVVSDGERWDMVYLIIKKNSRGYNYGDGLLRAILNNLANMGIEKINYKGYSSYLEKKGFAITNKDQQVLNISEFFSKGCQSCGETCVI